MNIWQGQRVRLRGIKVEDWPAFHQNDEDTQSAAASDAIYPPRCEAGTKAWAERQAAKCFDGHDMMLAIETIDGQLVGSINAHHCDARSGTFRYGVAIFRPHWRKGYAAEAVRILLGYFFCELRYEKVNAHVYAFNQGSIALQRRLGFTHEGTIRHMVFTGGCHHDEHVYGLVKAEFIEKFHR